MTDPRDIARTMVTLPGFRLWPGMRWRLDRQRPGGHDLGRTGGRVLDDGILRTDAGAYVHDDGGVILDLDDPATLGAVEHGLLAPAGVWVERTHSEWRATTLNGRWLGPWHDSLAAALVDGLRSMGGEVHNAD